MKTLIKMIVGIYKAPLKFQTSLHILLKIYKANL